MEKMVYVSGWARVSGLDQDLRNRWIDLLRINQKPTSEFSEPQVIRLFEEHPDGSFCVPRQFPQLSILRARGYEFCRKLKCGEKQDRLRKSGEAIRLRDEQGEALRVFLRDEESGSLGGILSAPAGWGKTVWALKLISMIGERTLILVHKEFLVNQWRERIAQFLPGVSVGLIQQDECDVNQDIVLGMIQSLSSREYPEWVYRHFPILFSDEVHRVSAPTWSVVVPKFDSRYRVGISATPYRKDGTASVFQWHIGDILFRAREQRLIPKIKWVKTNFRMIRTPGFNPDDLPRFVLLRKIVENEARNRLIVDELTKAVQAGRKIILFSERIKHLEDIFKRFKKQPGMSEVVVDYYIGSRSEVELKLAEKAQVILATYQMASEGLDIPSIDTVFLATPKADIKQPVGRILRPFEGKKEPIIVDFVDDVPFLSDLGKIRERYYRSLTS